MADTPTEAMIEAGVHALKTNLDLSRELLADLHSDDNLHSTANAVYTAMRSSAPQEPDDDAVEKLGSLIFMRGSDQTDHNAFISGFAYGRFSELDSEMALHWFMRGASTPAECGIVSEPRNLLARLQAKAPETALLHRQLHSLAVALHDKHYPEVTQWKPLDDAIGLLSQIDNMTTGLARFEVDDVVDRIAKAVCGYRLCWGGAEDKFKDHWRNKIRDALRAPETGEE